ncbi:TnsD family Tn7-like transposition protein [Virgibacillus sp. SK37]|uniref:TnsD family Tn7-like transposition protein n=1 Tax=Virgibacillus sp. SK37 TaxID=403957 RepID=UPI00069481DA|nr:TnsD family Tn7-like transposition protein [Virgibacillus sp. SK37]
MAYYTGRVKQKVWRDYFLNIYSEETLQLFHSSIKGEQDWLSLIVQKNRKSFHPIRHLLVMTALDITVEDVFNNELNQPFGQPNYPCQNIVCDYFNVSIIENVSITLCGDTKKPIGTFSCPICKFSYTRRGPDKSEDDKFRRTRVKSYGSLWESKLHEFSQLGLGLRALSRKMGADPNTIKRYLNADKESSLNIEQKVNPVKEDRQIWLSLQWKHPQKSIKQLREVEKALYMRLYRNDKEWLKANSPTPLKRTSTTRINWNKRDEEVLKKVTQVVENLLKQDSKPVRITYSKVGYLIGKRALLEKKLDKLPRTRFYLQDKIETVEEFQKRRILYTIKHFQKNGEELIPWKILRYSGIKDCARWLELIDSYTELKH